MLSTDQPVTSRNAEKYDAILEQAIRVFAEVGFRNADVQVIADKAGVGKGTVYRYFGNKEDLFWAACFSVMERLGDHVTRSVQGNHGALQTLRMAGMAYAEFFENNPHYLDVFVQDRAEFRGAAPDSHKQFQREILQVFAEVIERGIAEGEIRPLDAHKTITAMASMFYGTVNFACYVKDRYRLSELAEHGLNLFLAGIRQDRSDAVKDSDQ